MFSRGDQAVQDHGAQYVLPVSFPLTYLAAEQQEKKRRKQAKVRYWHVDEAGIYDGHVVKKSYSPVGTTPMVVMGDTKTRTTIVACTSNEGDKIKLLVSVFIF